MQALELFSVNKIRRGICRNRDCLKYLDLAFKKNPESTAQIDNMIVFEKQAHNRYFERYCIHRIVKTRETHEKDKYDYKNHKREHEEQPVGEKKIADCDEHERHKRQIYIQAFKHWHEFREKIYGHESA